MTKDTIQITITGPGGVINYEYYTILEALKNAGIRIVEDNSHPEENPHEFTREIKNRLDNEYNGDIWVKLSANHIPWGG